MVGDSIPSTSSTGSRRELAGWVRLQQHIAHDVSFTSTVIR